MSGAIMYELICGWSEGNLRRSMNAECMPADLAPMQSKAWLATKRTSSILTPHDLGGFGVRYYMGFEELATATEITASNGILWKALAASSMLGIAVPEHDDLVSGSLGGPARQAHRERV